MTQLQIVEQPVIQHALGDPTTHVPLRVDHLVGTHLLQDLGVELVARLDPDLLHPCLLEDKGGEYAGLEVVTDGDEDDVEVGQAQFGDGGLVGGVGHDDVVAEGGDLAGLALVDVNRQHLGILALQLFTQRAAKQPQPDDGKLVVHEYFLKSRSGILYSSYMSPKRGRDFSSGGNIR